MPCDDIFDLDDNVNQLITWCNQLNGADFPFHYTALNDDSKCEGDNSPVTFHELICELSDALGKLNNVTVETGDVYNGNIGTAEAGRLIIPSGSTVALPLTNTVVNFDLEDCEEALVQVTFEEDPDAGIFSDPHPAQTAYLVFDVVRDGVVVKTGTHQWQITNQTTAARPYADDVAVTVNFTDVVTGPFVGSHTYALRVRSVAGLGSGNLAVLDSHEMTYGVTVVRN